MRRRPHLWSPCHKGRLISFFLVIREVELIRRMCSRTKSFYHESFSFCIINHHRDANDESKPIMNSNWLVGKKNVMSCSDVAWIESMPSNFITVLKSSRMTEKISWRYTKRQGMCNFLDAWSINVLIHCSCDNRRLSSNWMLHNQ